MPDFFTTFFDMQGAPRDLGPANETPQHHWLPPASGFEAVVRGARNRCPNCARQRLFVRYLKPVAVCLRCGQNWKHQQADDFPAYLAILISGHILVPIIIALVHYGKLPLWALTTIILSSAILLVALLLQPAKGAVIAMQWWLGMHGFARPRDEE